MDIESAYAGLLLAVTVILCDGASRCVPAVVAWARSGFNASRQTQQRAAAFFIFVGILIFEFGQDIARTTNVVVEPRLAMGLGIVATLAMGYGAAVYHAARLATEGRGLRVARWYLRGAIIAMTACTLVVPLLLPTHAPRIACPGPRA